MLELRSDVVTHRCGARRLYCGHEARGLAMTTRLSLATLASLPADIARPRFDPRVLGIGIVHLGCGAFHRAHQAAYTQAAIEAAGGAWGICGVNLQTALMRDRLSPQDQIFALALRDGDGDRLELIGALREVLFAPESRSAVIDRLADPRTRIISLTVTEKGYCHDPATGRLNETHPAILSDLATPDAPGSTPGLIVAGLARRRARGVGGLAVMSCDNLPHNGTTLGGIVRRFAAMRDESLARWIDDHVAFPSTMVDRIVPATTAEDVEAVSRRLGLRDEAPVIAEPFAQWVIEEKFPVGRPAWDRVGVELVADVAPFEAMKLRLINGAHSLLAYLGHVAGHEFVFQAMTAPGFAELVRRIGAEATPTLSVPPHVDLARYREAIVARFANPRIRHRTWQIAMDGSQKLPQRLLEPIRANIAAGRPFDTAALGVAAWMHYVRGRDDRGRAIELRDPLARELAACAEGRPATRVRRLLELPQIFGADLPRHAEFVAAVTRWLEHLDAQGAAATAAAAASQARIQPSG
jgi:fructuronate reductase